jgi:Zn-dependent oligopeptidase
MKTLPLTSKDFAWVKWTPKQMSELAEKSLALKKENYKKIKEILPENRTYENTVFALDRADELFADSLGKMSVLSDISTKKEQRDAAHLVQETVISRSVELDYDRDLYISLVEYREGNFQKEKKNLDKADIKLLEESIKEYERLGFNLPKAEQKKFKALVKKNIQMGSQFNKNLSDYEDFILCTKEELAGLSERVVSSLAKDTKTGKYKVTLQAPHMGPYMSFAHNRTKREELAKKSLKKGGQKNLKLIKELAKIRHEMATILGYKHHADFRTENRMAKTGDAAITFQSSLLKKLLPKVRKETEELKSFAKTKGIEKVEYYDTSFVANAFKKELFSLEPETVREYFPLSHVQNEMLALFGKLYGLKFKKLAIPMWHKGR